MTATNPDTVKSVLFILAPTLTSVFRESHPLLSAKPITRYTVIWSVCCHEMSSLVKVTLQCHKTTSTYQPLQNTDGYIPYKHILSHLLDGVYLYALILHTAPKLNRSYSRGLYRHASYTDVVWSHLDSMSP